MPARAVLRKVVTRFAVAVIEIFPESDRAIVKVRLADEDSLTPVPVVMVAWRIDRVASSFFRKNVPIRVLFTLTVLDVEELSFRFPEAIRGTPRTLVTALE